MLSLQAIMLIIWEWNKFEYGFDVINISLIVSICIRMYVRSSRSEIKKSV